MKPLRLAIVGALLSLNAHAADIPLYPTGPAQDSAFLRFVNGGSSVLELQADGSAASLKLDGNQVSSYLPVPGGKPITGRLLQNTHSSPLAQTIAPGEFVTLLALPDSATGMRQLVVRDQPDDFNALQASLAFISADNACVTPTLRPSGMTLDLFKNVAEGSLQRRSINPMRLTVQLFCADQPTGTPLDLGQLLAGERYSVLLLPSAEGPRLLGTLDILSH